MSNANLFIRGIRPQIRARYHSRSHCHAEERDSGHSTTWGLYGIRCFIIIQKLNSNETHQVSYMQGIACIVLTSDIGKNTDGFRDALINTRRPLPYERRDGGRITANCRDVWCRRRLRCQGMLPPVELNHDFKRLMLHTATNFTVMYQWNKNPWSAGDYEKRSPTCQQEVPPAPFPGAFHFTEY